MKKIKANKIENNISNERLYSYLIVFGVTLLLVPLFVAAFFNHMYNDDFAYALQSKVLLDNKSGLGMLLTLFENAFSSAYKEYVSWSGCYTSYFFSALAPYIWGDQYTFLNTFILLGGFIILNAVSLKIILVDILKWRKDVSVGIGALFIGISISFIPSTAEAFYWFNGGFYNIIGYGLGLLLIALFLKVLFYKQAISLTKYVLGMILVSILFTGTNYSTILVYIVIYAFLGAGIIFGLLKVEKKRKRVLYCTLIFFYVGCAISVLAPGNSVRQNAVGGGKSRKSC